MILALLLLSLLLLMFLLLPVWYRRSTEVVDQSEENLRLYQERTAEVTASDMDAEQKAALQLELDREFLATAAENEQALTKSVALKKRWPLPIALLVLVLIGTITLYGLWGAGVELRAAQLLQKAGVAQLTEAELIELRDTVIESARRNPDNLEWSYIEGRMAMGAGEFKRAESIFADILVTLPQEAVADRAGTLSLLAQAKFFGNQQKADAATYALMKESISLDASNLQNLGLAGMMAFELGEYRDAVEHWKTLWLALPETPESGLLIEGIERAAEHLRAQGETVDMSFTKRAGIKVLVDVSKAARAAFSADTPVFVAARAVSGPPMPLAAQRLTLGDLPQVITLSDAQAMMAGMSISQFDQITVIARISPSGQPVAQPGDWQGQLSPVSNKHEGVLKLLIDTPVK